MANRDDVLLWSDGFWCFKGEYTRELLRDDEPSALLVEGTPEWADAIAKKSHLRHQA